MPSDADEALSEATGELLLRPASPRWWSANRLTECRARYGRSFVSSPAASHGIGRQMIWIRSAERVPGRGPLLAAGSVLAIEPMLTPR